MSDEINVFNLLRIPILGDIFSEIGSKWKLKVRNSSEISPRYMTLLLFV